MERLTTNEPLEISEDARALYARMAAGESIDGHEPGVDQLLNLGLVQADPAPSGGNRLMLVNPRYVSAKWEASLHAAAASMLTQASVLPDLLQDLTAAYDRRAADPQAGVIEYLTGSSAVNGRLVQILSEATREILVCQPGRTRDVGRMKEARERDLATLERGVSMRTIYHDDVRVVPGMDGWVASMSEAGAQIRTLTEDFPRIIIVDQRTAVIPGDKILTDSRQTVACVVHDRGVAGYLAAAFEHNWERAQPWQDGAVLPGLTARHMRVLRELEAEAGPDVIAAKMELSVRTVNGLISDIKKIFGVTTLFGMACAWKNHQGTKP